MEKLHASVVHVTSTLTETGLESINPAMRRLGELKCHLSAEGGLKADLLVYPFTCQLKGGKTDINRCWKYMFFVKMSVEGAL